MSRRRYRSRPLLSLAPSGLCRIDQPALVDYIPEPGKPCPYHPEPVQPAEEAPDDRPD